MEKYSTPPLVKSWFDDRKKPTVKQITSIFYKSARDFKKGKLSLRDFTDICVELFFNAYLGDRKKFPTGITISGPDYREGSVAVEVRRKNGEFVATKSELPPIKPDLNPKVVRALSEFSDPSVNGEANKYWRLKKKFWDKYLGFVK